MDMCGVLWCECVCVWGAGVLQCSHLGSATWTGSGIVMWMAMCGVLWHGSVCVGRYRSVDMCEYRQMRRPAVWTCVSWQVWGLQCGHV